MAPTMTPIQAATDTFPRFISSSMSDPEFRENTLLKIASLVSTYSVEPIAPPIRPYSAFSKSTIFAVVFGVTPRLLRVPTVPILSTMMRSESEIVTKMTSIRQIRKRIANTLVTPFTFCCTSSPLIRSSGSTPWVFSCMRSQNSPTLLLS